MIVTTVLCQVAVTISVSSKHILTQYRVVFNNLLISSSITYKGRGTQARQPQSGFYSKWNYLTIIVASKHCIILNIIALFVYMKKINFGINDLSCEGHRSGRYKANNYPLKFWPWSLELTSSCLKTKKKTQCWGRVKVYYRK